MKVGSLKYSLIGLFSQHRFEKLLKLILLFLCNNRWSLIADGSRGTLFPFRGDKPICSSDLTLNLFCLLFVLDNLFYLLQCYQQF